MAALDSAALERELQALRRQRYEASQRVRASRQPLPGPGINARNAIGESAIGSTRPAAGSSRFGADRGFGGPQHPRGGDGPRSLRDGTLPGRFGPAPSPRSSAGGNGFQDGPSRGRPEVGPAGRDPRDFSDFGHERNGDILPSTKAVPQRRRAVLSIVVSERPPQQDEQRDGAAGRDADREGGRNQEREADRDHGRGGWHGAGEDWDRGRDRSGVEEDSLRREHANPEGRGYGRDYDYGSGGRGVKRHVPTDGEKPGAGAAALTEDADGRKRARRLLGRALLGTLQKFRQEDAQFQASDAAARRAELARKAEEKAAAEAERLRREAAEERARKRQEELDALMDLNLATDMKVLELLYSKKLARRCALGVFLRADGTPVGSAGTTGGSKSAGLQPQAVYWMPVSHCPATMALKERQEKELKEWEETVLAEMEQEKEGLRLRAQARRQGMAERRQRVNEARAIGRTDGGTAVDARQEEEVDHDTVEDHEAFEGVELDAHPEDVEEDDQEDGGEMEVAAAIGFEQRDGAKRADVAPVAGAEIAVAKEEAEREGGAEGKIEHQSNSAEDARDDPDSGVGDEVVA